jgi:hypothetical protein
MQGVHLGRGPTQVATESLSLSRPTAHWDELPCATASPVFGPMRVRTSACVSVRVSVRWFECVSRRTVSNWQQPHIASHDSGSGKWTRKNEIDMLIMLLLIDCCRCLQGNTQARRCHVCHARDQQRTTRPFIKLFSLPRAMGTATASPPMSWGHGITIREP